MGWLLAPVDRVVSWLGRASEAWTQRLYGRWDYGDAFDLPPGVAS